MRKNSCGRLYFDGCDKCNAPYMDLNGTSMVFSNDFKGTTRSVKVRSGCNLTIFPMEDQEGLEIEMDSSRDVSRINKIILPWFLLTNFLYIFV